MATALILIDMINDFFHPQGAHYHPEFVSVLANVQRLLDTARRNGIVIIHAMEGHLPDHDQDFEWKKLPQHCVIGSCEAEPAVGIDIHKGEHVIRKRRYSAFFATDLDLFLRERSVDRLVIAGVKTNVCIRATAQDAFALGYDIMVVKEAVGSNHIHLHQAALEDIERYMGRVISLDECVALFESQGREAANREEEAYGQ
ncbi:MAG TPA: cysteine hydrolase [Anaerolineae bacterium]|nr:cysteine hydrolase [Anaerolineae bacterium]